MLSSTHPIAVSSYGDFLRDGRWHGVVPLAQEVSADQVSVIAAALKALDPHIEIVSSRVTLADGNGNAVVCDALKVTLASDPSDTLAAFVDMHRSMCKQLQGQHRKRLKKFLLLCFGG